MKRALLVSLLIFIPILLIVIGIEIWDKSTENATTREKDNALAKVAITGTIITTTAIMYMILFNFFLFKLY